jgi:ATP-dependent Clp protease protease subunit
LRAIFNISENETEESTLYLDGTIVADKWFDDEITPEEFKAQLKTVKGSLTVWINSPGGDCIAASEIYTALKEHKGNVTVKIDGIAASAASVIAMAGEKVLMSPTSMIMIHNPWTVAVGDKSEIDKTGRMLDSVKETIINAYALKTKLSHKKISELMDAETWLDVKEAKRLGFADDMLYTDIPEGSISNSLYGSFSRKFEEQQKGDTKSKTMGITAAEAYAKLALIK